MFFLRRCSGRWLIACRLKALEATGFNDLGQGLYGNRETAGVLSTLSRTHVAPRLLQEMSERFQRRFGNVMLNSLGVGLGNLGRDT
jgi:hypothetical protein